MKQIANYFLKGLLFLAPIVITVYVFVATFRVIDGWLSLPIPGVGVLFMLGAITGVGVLVSHIFAGELNRWADNLFGRLPLVKLLYTSVKDLLSAFVGETKRFQKPVWVELSEGVCLVGFLTRESLEEWGQAESVSVYLPQAYNFAGNLLVVHRSRIRPIPADSARVMAFVVSGGVSAQSSTAASPSTPVAPR
jgi:uncharacterized membrane protein